MSTATGPIAIGTCCRHCGAEMFWDGTRWRTVYVLSVDPDQCFTRNGQPVEPVNDGHEI